MKNILSFICLGWGMTLTVASASYEIAKTDHAVTASFNGQVLWSYRHDPAEGKPYFHPLASTSGTTFTDLRPKDHPWHYGVWFSWKYINGVNYWEENRESGKSDGETRIAKIHRHVLESQQVQFDLALEYMPAGSDQVVLREKRTVVVHPPDEKGIYMIDWFGVFIAGDGEVVLDRTPIAGQPGGKNWGGYSGWSVRMNPGVRGGDFINDQGAQATDRQPAKWMIYETPQNGSLLLMDHPENLNYPNKWYLHKGMPFFSPAVIHDQPASLKAGETLQLQYRLLVAPETFTQKAAEGLWNTWVEGVVSSTK